MQEINDSLIGMFAVSRAGHDKGSVYIIIGERDEYVSVADGRNRTIACPKNKNRKHIQIVKKGMNEELADKLRKNQPVGNEAIKYLIKTTFKL